MKNNLAQFQPLRLWVRYVCALMGGCLASSSKRFPRHFSVNETSLLALYYISSYFVTSFTGDKVEKIAERSFSVRWGRKLWKTNIWMYLETFRLNSKLQYITLLLVQTRNPFDYLIFFSITFISSLQMKHESESIPPSIKQWRPCSYFGPCCSLLGLKSMHFLGWPSPCVPGVNCLCRYAP